MEAHSLRPPPHLIKVQGSIIKVCRQYLTLTTLRRENWMGSCWGKSRGVKVFTRVGGHLKDKCCSGVISEDNPDNIGQEVPGDE